jgi:pimeloyl-ACP methyl ester carboxylesterase
MPTPETRYARSGDVSIAYQVLGSGELDVVFVMGWLSHLELQWADPAFARFLRRLASFSRLMLFDKRGTGLSDPVGAAPTLEERMDDIRAVMDAVGSERAALVGYSEGGTISALYAATYPQRVPLLVLYDAWATGPGASAEMPREACWPQAAVSSMAVSIERWGDGDTIDWAAPSLAGSAVARRGYGTFERASMSPAMARALLEVIERGDIRHVLPTLQVPTLVIHHAAGIIPAGQGRYLADQIDGARYVELPGADHAPVGSDTNAILDHIQEFLTGTRGTSEPDRALATVLFTDIVDSTARAAALGDAAWRELRERHDALTVGELERFGGREVKHTGDGVLAAFDSPARAIQCAQSLCAAARDLGVELRAGLHTGECERIGDDLAGIAVHIGARVGALARSQEVLVTQTVRDLVVGSSITFVDRGSHTLKGVPGAWRIYAVDTHQNGGTRVDERLAAEAPTMPMLDRVMLTLARRTPSVPRFIGRILRRKQRK